LNCPELDMPLILTDEQTMLRDSALHFIAENAPITQLRALRDQHDADGFSRKLWAQFAEMGYTGVLVPEAHGGLGLGHVEAGIIMEAIGHCLCASPFLASSVVAVSAIRAGGSAEQQARWLPELAAGKKIATLAIDEHSKHRPGEIATTASTSGGAYRLEGSKNYVLDGHVADWLLVAARFVNEGAPNDGVEPEVKLFMLDAKASGVSVERIVTVDAHNAARVTFKGVSVAASDVLSGSTVAGSAGATAALAAALAAALDSARTALAAEMIGISDETFERTVQYLKDRQQFGKTIGEFQALQHRAAELYCDIELARSAVIHAQQCLDAVGGSSVNVQSAAAASIAVAVAKARAGASVTRAVQEGVQMHGGMGMTDALDFGLFMKRARVVQELFGDSNFQWDRVARERQY
jgi:alkylation response protein AidB-like acyl-CoA dehydrogenase